MDLNAKGKCLTLLGISSVQRYVFASNRLRENAGASYYYCVINVEFRRRDTAGTAREGLGQGGPAGSQSTLGYAARGEREPRGR